jgi:sarcosine oxidase subunit beta
MNRAPDVLVVGGGLAGLTAALALARRGAAVAVLEREVAGRHASTLNAGGVRRVNRHPAELALAEAAFALWPRLSETLGADVGFRRSGHLLLAEDEGEMERLRRRAALGFAHERMVDAAEARQIAPALARHVVGGLWGAEDGHADPRATVVAYRDAAERAGAVLLECTALRGLRRDGGAWRADTSAGAVVARMVVNAAGGWGGEVALMAADPLPLEPRAPMALMTGPRPRFLNPVVQTLTRRLTLKQLDDGRVAIGGGHRARLPWPASAETVAEEAEANLATAASLFPAALGDARPARIWAGVEGYAPDGVAILGPSERVAGLVHAFGFSGHGFALMPAVGEAVAAMVQGGGNGAGLEGLAPSRLRENQAAGGSGSRPSGV